MSAIRNGLTRLYIPSELEEPEHDDNERTWSPGGPHLVTDHAHSAWTMINSNRTSTRRATFEPGRTVAFLCEPTETGSSVYYKDVTPGSSAIDKELLVNVSENRAVISLLGTNRHATVKELHIPQGSTVIMKATNDGAWEFVTPDDHRAVKIRRFVATESNTGTWPLAKLMRGERVNTPPRG